MPSRIFQEVPFPRAALSWSAWRRWALIRAKGPMAPAAWPEPLSRAPRRVQHELAARHLDAVCDGSEMARAYWARYYDRTD